MHDHINYLHVSSLIIRNDDELDMLSEEKCLLEPKWGNVFLGAIWCYSLMKHDFIIWNLRPMLIMVYEVVEVVQKITYYLARAKHNLVCHHLN